MKKTFSKIIITAVSVMLVFILGFSLTACDENFKWGKLEGASPEAETISLGGFVSIQGNYLYFINGYDDVETKTDIKHNYFGKVQKNAVVRVELDEDKNPIYLDEDGNIYVEPEEDDDDEEDDEDAPKIDYDKTFQTVVPKNIYVDGANGGFYIYGEWIYYATQSTKTDNKSQLVEGLYDFYRTKTDGTKTQKLDTLQMSGLNYKFTSKGLIYLYEGKLHAIECTADKVKKEQVYGENITSILFPSTENYNPTAESLNFNDYAFYTQTYIKEGKDDPDLPGNELFYFAIGMDEPQKLISITDNDLKGDEPTIEDKEKLMQYALKDYRIVDETKIELYYDKSHYKGEGKKDLGLFGLLVEVKDGSLTLNLGENEKVTDKEVMLVRNKATSGTLHIFGLAEGVLIMGSEPVWEKPKNPADNATQDKANTDKTTYKDLPAGFLYFADEKVEGVTETFVYYENSGSIYKCTLNGGHAVRVSPKTVGSSLGKITKIETKVFYVTSEDYNYIAYIDTANITLDKDGNPEENLLAFMTESDKKAWDKKQK